jgi:hypothetical protein
VSGIRGRALQAQLWREWQEGKRAGPVARPGTSNHEGTKWPRGAVDVTNGPQLAQVLRDHPPPGKQLRPFGPGDWPHFSATGR